MAKRKPRFVGQPKVSVYKLDEDGNRVLVRQEQPKPKAVYPPKQRRLREVSSK